MTIIKDLIFLLNKPKLIIAAGKGSKQALAAISEVLKPHFKQGKDVFVFESDLQDETKIKFFLKNSSLPIFVITDLGDAGKEEKIKSIVKSFSPETKLILNFDEEAVRLIKNESSVPVFTFGFQEGSDLMVSDITQSDEGVNFKINHEGSIVPVWINSALDKEMIYAVLAAACCGLVLGLNLIEISQALKSYRPE